jgi:hypothetical protein
VADTLLVISGHGIAPYSARGLTQTLEVVSEAAVVARSVNGGLVNLSPPQFRKFRSTIACTDVAAPALAALWPGVVVDVDCVSELTYLTSLGSPVPDRTVAASRTEGDYTYDRLRLTMMVVAPWTQSTDEYGASVQWQLELAEV